MGQKGRSLKQVVCSRAEGETAGVEVDLEERREVKMCSYITWFLGQSGL